MSYKRYKAAAAKIFYPTLYTMVFISLITARHYFLVKFIATQRLFATIILSQLQDWIGSMALFRLNNTLFVVYNKLTVINILYINSVNIFTSFNEKRGVGGKMGSFA